MAKRFKVMVNKDKTVTCPMGRQNKVEEEHAAVIYRRVLAWRTLAKCLLARNVTAEKAGLNPVHGDQNTVAG